MFCFPGLADRAAEVTTRLLLATTSVLEWCSERVELALDALADQREPRPITPQEQRVPAATGSVPDARKKKRRIVAERITAPLHSSSSSSNNNTPAPAPAPAHASISSHTPVPVPMATPSEDHLYVHASMPVVQGDASTTRGIEAGLAVVAALPELLSEIQTCKQTKVGVDSVACSCSTASMFLLRQTRPQIHGCWNVSHGCACDSRLGDDKIRMLGFYLLCAF